MFYFETRLTSNGQIILPQQAHKVLKTPKVRIIVETESVRLEPVSELAGCLKSYTKQLPMDEVREIAWTEAMYEKHLRD